MKYIILNECKKNCIKIYNYMYDQFLNFQKIIKKYDIVQKKIYIWYILREDTYFNYHLEKK